MLKTCDKEYEDNLDTIKRVLEVDKYKQQQRGVLDLVNIHAKRLFRDEEQYENLIVPAELIRKGSSKNRRQQRRPLTLKNLDPKGSREFVFPLFHDHEIGLGTPLLEQNCIEASMDDDVASDDNIISSAFRSCRSDVKGISNIINN